MCLMSWDCRLFLKGVGRLNNSVFQIINGLAQVPFEHVLIDVYKGTRINHKMKFGQMGHTTSQYGQLFSLKLLVIPSAD